MKKTILNLLNVVDKTYYNWKNENRPIIKLLEKYFTKEDLEEFISTENISKMERLDELLEIEKKYKDFQALFESHNNNSLNEKTQKVSSSDCDELFNADNSTQDISLAMGEIEKSDKKVEQRLG